jgi:predicted SnoaL-like aldol condensation-catalyzing enzyme
MQKMVKSEEILRKEAEHKRITLEFFSLVAQGKFRDGLRFFSPDCKTHNPYVAGSMETLVSAMEQANKEGTVKYPNAQFKVVHTLTDGDLIAVHTTVKRQKQSGRGWTAAGSPVPF